MPTEVHNEYPEILNDDCRVAFVGECPTPNDQEGGRPFVGPAGNILSSCMNTAGILRSCSLMANVVNVAPPGGHILRLSRDDWRLTDGRKRLRSDLDRFRPNVTVLMGQGTLKEAGVKHAVTDFRGTLFECREIDSPFYGRKCLATLRPSDIVRQYKYLPLFLFDLKRAKEEASDSALSLPDRAFDLHLTATDICERLDGWPAHTLAAIDIEGGINPEVFGGITCISIASSPSYAFIVDFKNMGDDDKPRVYDSLSRWLRRSDVPKIAQNFLYETMCCAWKWKTPIGGLYWDTMLSGWEIYPELPKALGTQASIWTREPFYKFERKIMDDETHNAYCCKDTTVTFEIYEKHKEYLADNPRLEEHFRFNQELIPAFSYMQLRGIRYDKARADDLRQEIAVEQDELQTRIDLASGVPVNVNSPKQMVELLYKRMGFMPQYKKEGGRKTNRLTADVQALLTLLKKHNSDLVYNILKWRQLDGVRKQLDISLDPDGRIRSAYNPVGTETGRLTCYASNTGSGYNLQTTTKRLRPLFLADEDHYIFQIDLSGADGWTVAAHSSRLGDPRMMEDYLRGVKPARVISAMYLRNDRSLASLDSDTLYNIIEETEIPSWLYNAAKAIQHGSCYGMGKITMSANILKNSWKHSGEPVNVAPKDCALLQDLFFARYIGVRRWQAWVKQELNARGELSCASGHVRKFFGRRTDNGTLQAAYSHEPQANTTYATNLALHRLWHDEDNRNDDGSLIIQPLHQVHDALIGQFPIGLKAQSIARLKTYFSNELPIADQSILIPFEGEYGTYWGDNSAGTI